MPITAAVFAPSWRARGLADTKLETRISAPCGAFSTTPANRGNVRPTRYHSALNHPTPGPKDWTPLFQAFAEALEWALDLAGDLARSYPAELATIERVRSFARKRISGDPAHVRTDDLLFAIGLIAGTIERDVRPKLAAPARTLPARRPPRSIPRSIPLRLNHRTPFSSAAAS